MPGYTGHQGTDIGITWEQMDNGVDVYAAANGKVLWVFDGKYDRCPNNNEPDCLNPNVCTELGPYCGTGDCCCTWCFAGGNVVIILHDGTNNIYTITQLFPGTGVIDIGVESWDYVGNGILSSLSLTYEEILTTDNKSIESPSGTFILNFSENVGVNHN